MTNVGAFGLNASHIGKRVRLTTKSGAVIEDKLVTLVSNQRDGRRFPRPIEEEPGATDIYATFASVFSSVDPYLTGASGFCVDPEHSVTIMED
jgi:hypothetical protein